MWADSAAAPETKARRDGLSVFALMKAAIPAVRPAITNTLAWTRWSLSPENRLASGLPPNAKMCRPITVWLRYTAPHAVTTNMFYASGGYDRIAEHVFRRAKFDRFLLEYDDARSGTFEPLKFVPDDRTVVLGLVSSKTPRMESSEDLKARIAEAAKIVPLDRLALSPQCGFASTHEGNALSAAEQQRKLELVASVAHEVWS